MEAVDKNVPLPVRDVEPMAMPIEGTFSISGPGRHGGHGEESSDWQRKLAKKWNRGFPSDARRKLCDGVKCSRSFWMKDWQRQRWSLLRARKKRRVSADR